MQPNSLLPPTAVGKPLPVPCFQQKFDRLCWAAAAQMVLFYCNFRGLLQCQLAAVKLKNLGTATNCCKQNLISFLSSCDHGVDEKEVAPIYEADPFHIHAQFLPTPLEFSDLETELYTNQSPVQVGILWNSTNPNDKSGHMVLVTGCYRDATGTPWVFVNDPLLVQTQPGQVRYEDLKSNYKNGVAGPGHWACSWVGLSLHQV